MASPPPGNSSVQHNAEPVMISWLSARLGVDLAPMRFDLAGGSHVRIDGASIAPPVLCEAWAHHGPPKPAQKFKVMNDAMKLVAAAKLFSPQPVRLILLFADAEAARPFEQGSWRAEALTDNHVEVMVAELDGVVRQGIRDAQAVQYR